MANTNTKIKNIGKASTKASDAVNTSNDGLISFWYIIRTANIGEELSIKRIKKAPF